MAGPGGFGAEIEGEGRLVLTPRPKQAAGR